MTDPASQKGPPRRVRRRVWPILGGMCLGALTLAAGSAAVLWLSLSTGPVALPAAVQARIQAALNDAVAQGDVEIGGAALALSDGGALQVALQTVTLRDPDGRLRAAFPDLRAGFAHRALLRGQLRLSRVEIAGADLRLRRDADGGFGIGDEAASPGPSDGLARLDRIFPAPALSDLEVIEGRDLDLALTDGMTGRAMRVRGAAMRLTRTADGLALDIGGALDGFRDARIDLAIARRAGAGETDLTMRFENLAARDVATAAPALAWLDPLRAPISGRVFARLGDDGTVGGFDGRLEVGPGQLGVDGAGEPLRFDRILAETTYDTAARRLRFDDLRLDAPELRFAATGHVDPGPDGRVHVAQVRLREIEADPRGLFEAPLTLDGAVVDLRLTLAPVLEIEIGRAVVTQDGLEAAASGVVRFDAEGVALRLDATIAEIAPDRVLRHWPPGAIPNTRRWVSENLLGGRLRGVDFALRRAPDGTVRHELQFDFRDARVRALPTLPPIEGGAGVLRLSGPDFMLRLDAGSVMAPGGGRVSLAGSTMRIADTRVRGPATRFDLAASGGLTDMLRLLTVPPVDLFAEGDMTPEAVGAGAAQVKAELDFPLVHGLTLPQVAFAVEGRVDDFVADDLFAERRIAAERLTVSATNDAVTVRGQARFEDVPLSGAWRRALGPGASPVSTVEARALIGGDALAALGVRLPPGTISGSTLVDMILTLDPETAPRLGLRSDLQGMAVSLPPLMWRLDTEQGGDLRADVLLGPRPRVTDLHLEGAGLSLSGQVDLTRDGGFGRLTADRLRVGDWLEVAGELALAGADGDFDVSVAGGVLDLRAMPRSDGAGRTDDVAGRMDVRLDRLQVTEGIALTDLRAELGGDGGLSGRFSGMVNGRAPVTGTLSATEHGPAVRIESEDGGAALRDAGVFSNAHGGAMELTVGAAGRSGTYEGRLKIDGPRLRDAPVMAELLNLISVVGLLEQLGGEGINLGDVDARFTVTSAQVVLHEATAVGPSLGLSMDGAYAIASRQFDMQGVIYPLYALNRMIGALFAPRREGLFGFSYRLAGTSENTAVTVNPLSILTPGVFREIFRRPPPEAPEPNP